MKSCPTCNRTYPDDTLAFCLMDGSVLSAPYDPSESKRGPARRVSGSATEVLATSEPPIDAEIPLRSTMRSPIETTRAGSSPAQSTMRVPSPGPPHVGAIDRQPYLESKPTQTTWIFRASMVLHGLAALFLVALFLTEQGLRLSEVSVIIGAYAVASGLLWTIAGIQAWLKHKGVWLLIVDGIFWALGGLGIFAILGGRVYGLFYPWLALWAVGSGILQILTAGQLRKRFTGGWLLALAGPVSMVCGLLFGSVIFLGQVFFFLDLKWVIILYLVVPGMLIVAFGFAAKEK